MISKCLQILLLVVQKIQSKMFFMFVPNASCTREWLNPLLFASYLRTSRLNNVIERQYFLAPFKIIFISLFCLDFSPFPYVQSTCNF